MLCELSNEELDQIAAVEVMGWEEDRDPDGTFYGYHGEGAPWGTKAHLWRPATDRNQSRLVVEAVIAKLGFAEACGRMENAMWEISSLKHRAWIGTTPRQEVEAAILAVRGLETPGDKP